VPPTKRNPPSVESLLFGTLDIGDAGSEPLRTRDIATMPEPEPEFDDSPPTRADGSPIPELRLPPGRAFTAALFRVWKQAKTGLLIVRAEGVQTTIYVKSGCPVYAEGGTLGDTLGRLLVRLGLITEEDFLRANDRMAEGIDKDERLRFGDVLVELKIMTARELDDALRTQVRHKILSCFQWEEIRAWLDEGEDLLRDVPLLPVRVPRLLADGCSRFGDEKIVEAMRFERGDQYPVLREPVGRLEEILGLDAAELELLPRMTGQATLEELEGDPRWTGLPSSALVVALFHMGVLDFEPSAKGAAPRAPSPPPRAPPKAAAPSDPAQSGVPSSSPIGRVTPKRKPQASSDFSAEVCFNRGLQLLERSEPKPAADLFARAVQMSPGKLEYALHHAYAMYLAAPDPAQGRALMEEARALAFKALKQDESLSKAHTILGRLLRVEGDNDQAIKHFNWALEINPKDREAERELRLLRNRAEEGRKQSPLSKFLFRWDKEGE
jgi:hypothetical protein